MSIQQLPLERAFELARSGRCNSIIDIRNQLKSEGVGSEQITGATLLRQLREIMKQAGASTA